MRVLEAGLAAAVLFAALIGILSAAPFQAKPEGNWNFVVTVGDNTWVEDHNITLEDCRYLKKFHAVTETKCVVN